MALKRIHKELKSLEKEESTDYQANPKTDNMFEWQASINGPEYSPYGGGGFFLDINFPADYPFKPPKVKFMTKIYHCNVDDSGGICLPMLKDEWSPALTIVKVLQNIYTLLNTPNLESPLKPDVAELYNSDRKKHDDTAEEWTQKYAM